MVARTGDVLELSYAELCVLRWLRINNGKATLTAAVAGNGLSMAPERLLKADYVTILMDQSSPKAVHYVLTNSGRAALELNERRASIAPLAGHGRPRAK